MTATRLIKPFGLRMQPEDKARIEERAKRNGRSMNSEIIQILKEALTAEQTYYTACMESGIEPIIPTEK